MSLQKRARSPYRTQASELPGATAEGGWSDNARAQEELEDIYADLDTPTLDAAAGGAGDGTPAFDSPEEAALAQQLKMELAVMDPEVLQVAKEKATARLEAAPEEEKEARQAELDAIQADLDRRLVLKQDLAILRDPFADPADRHAVLRRQDPEASASPASTSSDVERQTRLGDRVQSEKSSTLQGGRQTTKERTTKTGVAGQESDWKHVDEDADGKDTVYRQQKRGLGGVEDTVGRRSEFKQDGKDVVETYERKDAHKAGERSSTTTRGEQIGDELHQAKTSKKTTYGRNGVAHTQGETVTEGKVDGDGNLVQGRKSEKSTTVGGTMKDGKLTGNADHSRTETRQHNKHLSTKTFGNAGASVSIQIERKDGQYILVTTITLKGGLGVGADGKADKGGVAGTLGGTASVNGSVTLSTRKVLDEDGMLTYVAALQAASRGDSRGGSREMAVLFTAATQGPKEAIDLVQGARAQMGSADAARDLVEGEAVQLDTKLDVKGEGKAGATYGKGGLGASVKVGGGRDRQVLVERKGGKVHITVVMVDSETFGGGATASYGHAGGKFATEETEKRTRLVKFVLDPSDADFDERYAEITGASEPAALDKARSNAGKDRVETSEEGRGTEGSTTTGVTLGPMGLDLTNGHSYTDTYVIEDGELKRKIRGANGGGAEAYLDLDQLGAPGWVAKQLLGDSKLKVGSKGEDSLDVTIGPDGQPVGKLLRQREETGNVLDNDTPPVEGLDVRGKQWLALDMLASDPNAWAVHNGGFTRNEEAWLALGRAVRAAKGDTTKIAIAAAQYMDQANEKGKDVLQTAIRPTGSVGAATRVELPPSVANLQKDMDTYVLGEGAKDKDPAEVLSELERMRQEITAAEGDFRNPAAYADAMASIRKKKDEARERLRAQRGGSKSLWDRADPGREQAEPGRGMRDPFAPQEQPLDGMAALDAMMEDQELEEGKWNGLTAALDGYLQAENKAFAGIEALVVDRVPDADDLERKGTLIAQVREVHTRWKADLEEAIAEGERLGEETSTLPRPNEALLNSYADPNRLKGKIESSEIQAAKAQSSKAHGGGSSRRAATEQELEAEYQRQQQVLAMRAARTKLDAARAEAIAANGKATGMGNHVNNTYLSKGSYPEALRVHEQGRKLWVGANGALSAAGTQAEGSVEAIDAKALTYRMVVSQYQGALALFSEANQLAQQGR